MKNIFIIISEGVVSNNYFSDRVEAANFIKRTEANFKSLNLEAPNMIIKELSQHR